MLRLLSDSSCASRMYSSCCLWTPYNLSYDFYNIHVPVLCTCKCITCGNVNEVVSVEWLVTIE